MVQGSALPQQQIGANVIGEGTVNAVPDIIALTVGIESSGDNAVQALDGTNKCMLGVIDALLRQGLNQSEIRTVWVGVYPAYAHAAQLQASAAGAYAPYAQNSYAQNNPQTYAQAGQAPYAQFNMYPQNAQAAAPTPGSGGYAQNAQPTNAPAGVRQMPFAASVWLQVSLREVNRTGEILDAAFGAGATYCGGQSFGLQDESAARRAALDAAGKDAQAKAKVLAVTMGRQLGKPLAVVEEYTAQNMGIHSNTGLGQMPGLSAGANQANAAMTSPGELIFTSRVRVTYELV